jgi:ABC-type branched-subunit amino acid transport system substrate-binding protein
MYSKKKILAAVLLVVLVVVTVAGCAEPAPSPTPAPAPAPAPAPTPAPQPEHITVGAILPLSGPISTIGMCFSRGYELYFEKLNAAGGLTIRNQTYLFDFKSEDSQMSPDAAAAAARKLIHQDGATFIFGAIIEAATAAINEVCAEANVPQFLLAINIPGFPGVDVSLDKPLTARPLVSFDTAFSIDFDYMLEAYPDVKTLAITYPDLGYEGMIESPISRWARRSSF